MTLYTHQYHCSLHNVALITIILNFSEIILMSATSSETYYRPDVKDFNLIKLPILI